MKRVFTLACTIENRQVAVVVEGTDGEQVCGFEFEAAQRLPKQDASGILAWSPEAEGPAGQIAELFKRLQGQREPKDPLDTLMHIALHQMIAEIEKALEPDA